MCRLALANLVERRSVRRCRCNLWRGDSGARIQASEQKDMGFARSLNALEAAVHASIDNSSRKVLGSLFLETRIGCVGTGSRGCALRLYRTRLFRWSSRSRYYECRGTRLRFRYGMREGRRGAHGWSRKQDRVVMLRGIVRVGGDGGDGRDG